MDENRILNGSMVSSDSSDDAALDGPIAIDPSRGRFPFCLVWSPLPVITWILPFIGHTGICDSDGIIWDFAGPYTIGRERMAFGAPTRYLPLNPALCRQMAWNDAVREANKTYSKRMHNLFCDNCHSHVACALNLMEYNSKRGRGMVGIGVWFFFFGRFTSVVDFIRTYLPFTILLLIYLGSTGKLW
jgi:hypothetical protein